MNISLPAVIRERLLGFERRRKLLLCSKGVAESLMVLVGGLLAVTFLEWAIKPKLPARLSLSVLNYVVFGAVFIWRGLLPLMRSRSLREIAWSFELAARGRFEERVVSAVELSEAAPEKQPGVSQWMVERTVEMAAEQVRHVNGAGLVSSSNARRQWRHTATMMGAVCLLCLLPGMGTRAWVVLNPFASTGHLSKFQLAVRPGDARVRQGAALEISASGLNLPEDVKAAITWEDGFQESVPMGRSGTNEFNLALPSISQGFRYRVEAGDVESASYRVKLDVPPRITRLQTEIEPPEYTHWTNRIVEGGNADFLIGSRLRLMIETADEKVADNEWVSDLPQIRKLKVENNRLVLQQEPTNEISYQIRLLGENGLKLDSGQKWTWRPRADEFPLARLALSGGEAGLVQSDEVLPLTAYASDDVGLKRVELIVISREAEASVKPLYVATAEGSTLREFKQGIDFNLAEVRCATGDEVQFQLSAVDVRDQASRSDPLTFTIGATDKAQEAQLAARVRKLVSEIAAQADDLQQTRGSWLSISRNFREQEPGGQRPALTVLKSRLNQFGAQVQAIGDQLVNESETNNAPEARFMYRLGTTISAWGRQQREVLLANCGRVEQAFGTNLFESFSLGRELFSRALLDLEQDRKVVSVLAGVFETDVLATRCETSQSRYKRGLPVIRGENTIAPLGTSGSGLRVTFFEGTDLGGKQIEQKVENPRFDNLVPAGRREHWSARYEGEINITQEDDWTIGCMADDGVRLKIEGKSLLPGESWANHPATLFKGETRLTAGWHPITIEFFQGSSESKLQLMAAKKGEALQEVPVHWLRPPGAGQGVTNAASLSAVAKEALKDRVRSSLMLPATVPTAVAPLTNDVEREMLVKAVLEKFPIGESLSSNLGKFAAWTPDESHQAEGQADELTNLAKDAQRMLKEELEKYRWRYEGAAALKEVQNAIQELREINRELRQQPWHDRKTRTDAEQSKIELARAWHEELSRATAEASHEFFEVAKQRDGTLAERAAALSATTKIEKEFEPAVKQLAETLSKDYGKDEMAGQIDQRIEQLNERFHKLNDLQERINREEVAARARKAMPAARSFEQAQKLGAENREIRYDQMRAHVGTVSQAQRIAGDYSGADRLEKFAGSTLDNAQPAETSRELRDLASRTDRNFDSLAQTIPPPMRDETQALEKERDTAKQAANNLAKPRLAMAIESARLAQNGDRKLAIAYGLLGQDLGALVDSPATLNAPALKPLADRATALAGEKGEEARQAEIRAAYERVKQLADNSPLNPEALANQLEEMSVRAKEAAGDNSKRSPFSDDLSRLSKLALPVPDWYEAKDAKEIAAGAAQESSQQINAAPNQWESYNDTSQRLADAARQIQMSQAAADLAELNPYGLPQSPAQELAQGKPGSSDQNGDIRGLAGKALTQPAPRGMDQAEWARLNERLRSAIRSSGIENFSEEHQAAIRAYFERLSTDSQKRK